MPVSGSSLLESAYQHCLMHELALRGVAFRTEVPLPVVHKETKLDCGYRMDLVVEDRALIEVKSVEALAPIHDAQVLTYLKLKSLPIMRSSTNEEATKRLPGFC